MVVEVVARAGVILCTFYFCLVFHSSLICSSAVSPRNQLTYSIDYSSIIISQTYYHYQIIRLSTMTSLSQQLSTLKHQQRAVSVTPQQQQPTLVLDRHTATTASSDLFYTMAVIAYSKLVK